MNLEDAHYFCSRERGSAEAREHNNTWASKALREERTSKKRSSSINEHNNKHNQ